MSKEAIYQCENSACPLGSRADQGFFTGGMSEQGRAILGLEPDHPVGPGICPSCGVKGTKTGDVHKFIQKEDPYQHLHDQVQERVLDENDPLTGDDAQAELTRLVEKEAESA